MEIDEVVARVLRHYWVLLLVCVALPLVAVSLLVQSQPPVYAAHARIVTGSTVPSSSAEADGIVSQVRGLATGRSAVTSALASAHATRDVKEFTSKHITVTGLGTSQIVDLTVTDHDPRVAQRVDATLAREVADVLNKVGKGGLTKTLGAIDDQLMQLSQKRAHLISKTQADPGDQAAQDKLAGIEQMISDLSGNRSDLVSRAAMEVGRARVVDTPVVPTGAEPTGLMQKLMLAGVLGLVVGVLLAALMETLRPTVPGAPRVARRLGTPFLGRLGVEELRGDRASGLSDLARGLRLAARRAGVSTVVLVEASPTRRAEHVVSALEKVVPLQDDHRGHYSPAANEGTRGSGGASTLRRVCQLRSMDRATEAGSVGLVVLAGPLTRLADVAALRDLQQASGWPLLGVVGVPRRWRPRVARRRIARLPVGQPLAPAVSDVSAEPSAEATTR